MTESFEIPLLATEASISLDAAMAAAEQMASHGIVESSSFESLMTLLEEAASAIDQIRRAFRLDENRLASSASMTVEGSRQITSLQLNSRAAPLVRSTSASPPALRLISAKDR
jgi:hypothetical protein